jgi:hypothetical protein
LRELTQWLLLQEQEAGVNELDELGEVVEVVENDQLVGPATLMAADCEEQTLSRYRGDQLLGEQRQEYAADGGEVEIVHLEQEVELEWLTLAHQLPPAEDYNVVCEKRNSARLERGEGCLAGNEAEVLRFIAGNWLESCFENRPQLEAEGAVERGDAIVDEGWETHCVR